MAAGADLTTLPLSYGAVALLLVAALIWAAKQYLGEFFKKSGASAFDRSRRPLSRGAKFRRRLVRRYADAVEQDFTRHPVGFVADQVIDINETYVPLQYELDGERRDVYDNIRENPCTVVIGPAGAGKSLLLKNSMLTWAKRVRGGRSERVPVLIELHRCNGTTDSLVDLIVAELARARVDRSRGGRRIRELVQQALDDGALSLLFDGLDEVGRADQERVFAALRDFAREYGDCQFVVTCRDVVYQGQPLGPRFSHVVRVAEFDDAGVIRFLGSWRGLGAATASAEIFGSLRKNPALMRLARSPLLLTMIAYLHTEVFTKSGRRLPTSRPAFYQEAITHLLGRDADLGRARSLTVYEVGEKLAVLQKVALTSMESTGTSVDRLTISRMTLETTTKALLPDLNLDDSHIKSLLDEIVDRSQLLVAVDKRKAHYVFRHLTLQEYLAATELADSPDSLLERYLADPLAWRETVKLWCGASNRDSTKVIAEIFGSPEAHHKILALECLSEAKRVDGDFATMIVNHFLRQLGVVGPDRAAVVAALGSVAADSRPRGQEVLRRLASLALSDGPAKVDAMQALSASGRPEAALVLAPQADADADGRAALRGMGELALTVLTARAAEGFLWAVDDLAVVGTPAAATALVDLLWTDGRAATRAAWRLAELIRNPDVEEQLRRASPAVTDVEAEAWMWQPFRRRKDDPLLLVGGRIGRLLRDSDVDAIPPDTSVIDPRLAIPVALDAVRGQKFSGDRAMKEIRERIPRASRTNDYSVRVYLKGVFATAATVSEPDDHVAALLDSLSRGCGLSSVQLRLLGLLSWPARAAVYGEVLSQSGNTTSSQVRNDDWLTVFEPRRGTRHLWSMTSGILGCTGLVSALAGLYGSFLLLTRGWELIPTWVGYVNVCSIAFIAAVVLYIYQESINESFGLFFALGGLLTSTSLVITGVAFWWERLSWQGIAGVVGVNALAVLFWFLAHRRDRVNDNPFRRCLEADASRLDDRTSVIAS